MMTVVTAIAVFFSASALKADEPETASSESKGFGAGVVVGVLVGGPVGAVIGAGVGAWLGNRSAVAGQVEPLQRELDAATTNSHGLEVELVAIRQDLQRKESLIVELQEQQAPLGGLSLQVLFRTGNADLVADTQQRLAELAEILGAQPRLTVAIDGYADQRGDEAFNLDLSRARAETVLSALFAYGVPVERMQVHAHGEVDGGAEDGDLDAYALERRVTIRLVEPVHGKMASN